MAKYWELYGKNHSVLEITEELKAGENKIEVKVTNLWVNRLIGDAPARR